MAIQRDITAADDWFTGEDKRFNFLIYQADGVTPQDLSDWSLNWMLKKRATDADSAAKVTKTATIVDPVAGTCTVTIADTDTATLPAGTYVHELKRTDDGSETVLTFGTAALRQAVHR